MPSSPNCWMLSDLSDLSSKLHDTALAPDGWPEALKSLTDVTGAAGAAYIAFNKITARVERACFSGLCGSSLHTSATTLRSTPIHRCLIGVGQSSLSACQTRCYGEASGATTLYWRAGFAT